MKLYKLYDWDSNTQERWIKYFVVRYDNGLTFISSAVMLDATPQWTKWNDLQELIETIKTWTFMIHGIQATDDDILVESSELEYLIVKGTAGLEDLQKLIEDEKDVQVSW